MFLSVAARMIGNIVIVGLAMVGARTLFNKVMCWKHAHDNIIQAA